MPSTKSAFILCFQVFLLIAASAACKGQEADRRLLELSLRELLTIKTGENKGHGLFFNEHNKPDGKSVNIGILVPFNNLRQAAVEHIAAAEFAVQEINRQGGINGKRLVLVRGDDNDQPSTAVDLSEQMLEKYNIRGLLGPLPSQNAKSVINAVINKHKILHFLPAANANELDVVDTKDQVFRLAPTNSLIVQSLARFLSSSQSKKVAVVFQRDIFGREIRDGVETLSDSYSYKVVDSFSLSPLLSYQNYDLSAELKKMQRQRVDAIVLPLLPVHFKGFYNQLRTNWKGKLPLIVQPEHVDTSKTHELFDDSQSICVFASVPTFSVSRLEVLNGISNVLHTQKTSYTAAIIYDSVYLLASAIEVSDRTGMEMNKSLRKITVENGRVFTKRDFGSLQKLIRLSPGLSFVGETGQPHFDEFGNNTNIQMSVVGFHDQFGPGCDR